MSPLPETPPVEYITADLGTVLVAVRALNDAVPHDEALLLLECMRVDHDRARLALEMAKAEVVWRQDWLSGRRSEVAGYLDTALALAAQVGVDDVTAWDLTTLMLRRENANALVHPDGSAWFGPEGRAPGTVDELAERGRYLDQTAPDARRRGWALMSRGWIADNLAGDRHTPPAFYAEALRLGRVSADEKRGFDAQRHLGDPSTTKAIMRPHWRPGRGQPRRRPSPATSPESSRSRICWRLWLGRRDRRRAQPCWPRRPDAGQRPSVPPRLAAEAAALLVEI